MAPEPEPLRKPDRSSLTMRHMAVAVGVLVVVVLVLGFLSSGAGFAPVGPTVDDSAAPTVDAPAELTRLGAGVGFPLRAPATPPGWRSNSVGLDPIGPTNRAVRVGYVTAGGTYVQLQQTDAPEDALLQADAGARVLPAQGPQDVGGRQWVVYGTRPGEPVWIADAGAARWSITGSGTDQDFATLASAVAAAR